MPNTPGNQIPKIKLPAEEAQGMTSFTKESKDPGTKEVTLLVSDDKKFATGWIAPAAGTPTASVAVGLGALVGLPEFSNVRYSIEVILPTVPTNEGIDKAYVFGREWCLKKMHDLAAKVLK